MQTESNIANEIDAIIAQAMAEYQQARGVEVFSGVVSGEDIVEGTITNAVGPDVVIDSNTSSWNGYHSTDEISAEPSVIIEEPVHEEIPVNSQSILVAESTSRFSGAVWFSKIQEKTITLAGLGGIGSYVGFLLSRMHPANIILYDDDTVETANLSGQLYGIQDVGRAKGHCLSDFMRSYSEYYDVANMGSRFTENDSPTDIMICGFDNMEARKTFYLSWKRLVASYTDADDKKKCLFIDGRLAAESFQVLCIIGGDTYNMEKYERDFLFSDEEADETICSYKQTTFMANMIASVMVNLFVNFCANQCDPLIPRDLPFFTEYTAETMYFKVIA